MKQLLLFTGFILLSLICSGQKLKQKAVEVSYVKAPLTPVAGFVTDYDFVVEENNMDIKGTKTTLKVYSGANAYDSRSAFYLGFSGLGHINGLHTRDYKQDSDEKVNHISLKVGIIDVASKEVVQNGSLQGSVLPALCYQLQISVPIELRLSDSNRKEFYYRTTADEDASFTYKFPGDYQPTSTLKGYGTTNELEAAFLLHRSSFLLEVRNQQVKKWVYETKMDISSRFVKQRTDMAVGIYYIKEKKDEYADVAKLVAQMDTLFVGISRDTKAGANTNWHIPAYRTQFSELAAAWQQFCTGEVTNAERFSGEMMEGFYKNQTWCLFFAGEMDTAIALAKEKMTTVSSNASLMSFGVYFDDLLVFAEDYKKRYQANKDGYGW